MKIIYKKLTPATARCWFARFEPHTCTQILDQLHRWQAQAAEASVLGTDQDRELWRTVTQAERAVWGVSSQHGHRANTMLSVLAGAVSKLRAGHDLTEKQLTHVTRISQVMSMINSTDPWQFEQVATFAEGNTVAALQERLFDIT